MTQNLSDFLSEEKGIRILRIIVEGNHNYAEGMALVKSQNEKDKRKAVDSFVRALMDYETALKEGAVYNTVYHKARETLRRIEEVNPEIYEEIEDVWEQVAGEYVK